MELIQLPNDGYIRSSLSKELFDTLLTEGLGCYNNQIRITALKRPDGTETCPHYTVSDKNYDRLKDFIFPYIDR